MADRDIFCCKCNTYVGTIRDAKLKKGLTFVCEECSIEELRPDTYSKDAYNGDFTKVFNDIFSGKYKP